MEVDCFIDGPDGNPRDAVHIIYANEKGQDDNAEPSADVVPVEHAEGYDILPLATLVRMKLNAFRIKDRLHLLDMLDVGLIDLTWTEQLSSEPHSGFSSSSTIRMRDYCD